MRFSVGFWDALFGEKAEVEVRAPDGRPVRRKVTKKWLELMQRQGKMMQVQRDPSQVRVHMLHVVHGYSEEWWTIGRDVDADTVRQFQDEAGDLYAITAFEDGEPKVAVLKKEIWERGRAQGLGTPAI